MRMQKRYFAVPAILAGVVWSFVSPSAGQDDSIHWLNNYRAALREAKQTGKPIFLEFRCEP